MLNTVCFEQTIDWPLVASTDECGGVCGLAQSVNTPLTCGAFFAPMKAAIIVDHSASRSLLYRFQLISELPLG